MAETRKNSPRAPTMSLSEALDKAMVVYESEGKHVVASAAVAQDLGYKDASNGAALTALAAIKSYSLLISPARGQLAVSEDVEEYKYSTSPEVKKELLIKWLRFPQVYAALLDAFPESLPSDAAVKYELIKMGFVDKTANSCLKQFKASIEFAGYYDMDPVSDAEVKEDDEVSISRDAENVVVASMPATSFAQNEGFDRIPIRLAGGRKAWLEVPLSFYEKDKEVIKKYVDIIVVDEE